MRVLVLVVDGLQPAYMGPYGNEEIDTPTLDQLAASGVVFDSHFGDSIDTGSSRSIGNIRRQSKHLDDLEAAGIRVARVAPSGRGDDNRLALQHERRAVRRAIESLGDTNDAVIWVESDALLPPWPPFAETDDEEDESIQNEQGDGEPDENTPPTYWLGSLPDRLAPADDETFLRLQRTYGAAVSMLDASLERLLGDCAKRGWGDDVLWVLTSSRGLPLGEHEVVGFAGGTLHEEIVHLPLMLRWPNAENAGLRVSALTQPASLAATLTELFGVTATGAGGTPTEKSLVALARGADGDVNNEIAMVFHSDERRLCAIRTVDWYLILDDDADGSRQLYVKPDDRWEVNNVYQHHIELADEMERHLRESLKDQP